MRSRPSLRPRGVKIADRHAVLLLFGVALFVRLLGIAWGLPSVFEEAYPLKIAWRMTGLGTGTAFTFDPRFFHYPSLMIYLQLALLGILRIALWIVGVAPDAGSFTRLYAADPTVFYLAGRGLTSLLGALTVFPVYLLGRRAGGPVAALLAGAFVTLNPALIAKSQMIDVDIPLVLMTTWALALSADLAERLQTRLLGRSALVGAVAGFAAATKYPGILAIIPVWLALAARASRGRVGTRLAEAATAAAAALVVFFAVSPFLLLDAGTALQDLAAEGAHLRLGHFGSEGGAAWVFYAHSWFADSFGWLVGALAVLGILRWAVWKRERWAVLSGAFVLVLVLVVSAWTMKADRYLFPVVPAGSVFAAVLIASVVGKINRRPASMGMAIGLMALCLVTDLPRWSELVRRQQPDPRAQAKAWIESTLPDGSMLVIEPYGPHLRSPLDGLRTPEDLRTFRAPAAAGEPRYWIVPLPLFQVAPERTAVFYDQDLYSQADAWIVTGAVKGRYRREPGRFPAQNAFYNWLETHWRKAAEYGSGTSPGSQIEIFRNPTQSVPFGARVVPPPRPTAAMLSSGGVGGEAAFYYALGMNYYGYGRLREAADCFQTALAFPVTSAGVNREQLESALYASQEDTTSHAPH